jgi:hypothetical protein
VVATEDRPLVTSLLNAAKLFDDFEKKYCKNRRFKENCKVKKVKLSRYMPWRHKGGDEV